MFGRAVSTVVFEEHPRDEMLRCVPYIVAAFQAGWRFVPPPHVAHGDYVFGADRLQNFKHLRGAQLRREVHIHFLARAVEIEGERMNVQQFIQRCTEDPAFWRRCLARPRFEEQCAALRRKLAAAPRVAVAIDRYDSTRQAFGRLGGDPITLAAMARFHENGVA